MTQVRLNDPRDPRPGHRRSTSTASSRERPRDRGTVAARRHAPDGASSRTGPSRNGATTGPSPAAPRAARPRSPPTGRARVARDAGSPAGSTAASGRRTGRPAPGTTGLDPRPPGRRNRAAVGNPRKRSKIALIVLLSMLVLAGGKLVDDPGRRSPPATRPRARPSAPGRSACSPSAARSPTGTAPRWPSPSRAGPSPPGRPCSPTTPSAGRWRTSWSPTSAAG